MDIGRGLIAAALLLVVVASTASASAPTVVWFSDSFDGYPDNYWGVSLKDCGPKWSGSGMHPRVFRSSGDEIASAPFDGIAALDFTGTAGNGNPGSVDSMAFGALSPGAVQIMHFRSQKGYSSGNYTDHGGIFMVDANGVAIAGWVLNNLGLRGRISATGPNQCLYNFTDTEWHDFDVIYDPTTGAGITRWIVDGAELAYVTQTADKAVDRIHVHDYYEPTRGDVWVDELRVGTYQPVVTDPVGHVSIGTDTPTVRWTNAHADQTPTAYRVIVCASDNPKATAAYDSGVVIGSATSHTIAPLPTEVWLYAFVQEQYAGGLTSWSATGAGGFMITFVRPDPPVVTAPSGTTVGAKPGVTFTCGTHTSAQVKITADPAGNSIAWGSAEVATSFDGLACPAMLNVNTDYYAWARIGNAAGWSDWSSPKQFTVTRAGEGRDTRHFSEEWTVAGATQSCLYHSSGAPNDGFGTILVGGDINDQKFTRFIDYNAQNATLDMQDNVGDQRSRELRKHRVLNIDLDKGVTYLAAVRMEDTGSDAANEIWQACNFIINDAGAPAAGDEAMASFRLRQTTAAVCSDGLTYASRPISPTFDWQIVRMTGRNKIVGDPSSCEWKLYLNENPTPILTSTGCTTRPMVQDGPLMDEDFIGIGQGSHARMGAYYFDWTDVNTSGDYSPDEWNGLAQGTFATIGEARSGGLTTVGNPRPAGTEAKIAEITGPAIITYEVGEPPSPHAKYIVRHRIIGYEDWDGDGDFEWGVAVPEVSDTIQVYYAQDITPAGSGAALRINDSDNMYAAPGMTVTHMKGWLQQTLRSEQTWNDGHDGFAIMHYHEAGWYDVYGPVLRDATVDVSTDAAPCGPVFMSQSAVAGGGCTNQFPNGINNSGTYARVFGKVTYVSPLNTDLVTGQPDPAPNGSYTVCLDDGTGLLNYEQEAIAWPPAERPERGIYVTLDLNSQPGFPVPQVGEYYTATGIVGSHSYWVGSQWPTTFTLKSLHYATLERILP